MNAMKLWVSRLRGWIKQGISRCFVSGSPWATFFPQPFLHKPGPTWKHFSGQRLEKGLGNHLRKTSRYSHKEGPPYQKLRHSTKTSAVPQDVMESAVLGCNVPPPQMLTHVKFNQVFDSNNSKGRVGTPPIMTIVAHALPTYMTTNRNKTKHNKQT